MYQPGAGGNYNLPDPAKTWCNQSTFDVAEVTGFHAEAMYGNESRYNVSANEAADNIALAAANPKSGIKSTNADNAQRLANMGFTVIVAQKRNGIGHLSTVRPTGNQYLPGVGPLLSNVGGSNGIKSTAEGFDQASYDNGNIQYYYDENQRSIYDPSKAVRDMTQ